MRDVHDPIELGQATAIPWRRIALLFVITRLLAIAWIIASAHLFPESHFARVAKMQYPHPMMNWDSAWYAKVVQDGYSYTPGKQSNVAFFPLYPMCAAVLFRMGFSAHWALMLVSNASALLAAFALWRAVESRHGRGCADDSTVLFLCNPMTVFFMAGYTESTFLLLSILSISLVRGSPRWAAVAGLAAGLTRTTGVLLALPMALEAIVAARERGERRIHLSPRLLCAGTPILGLLLWCAYLYLAFGDPMAFANVQPAWGRRFRPLWDTFGGEVANPFYHSWFVGFAVGTTLILAAGAWLRLHWTWNVYAILSLLLFFQAGGSESTPRFEFGLFTIYPAAALICQRFGWMRSIFVACFTALAMVALTLFTRGYWLT